MNRFTGIITHWLPLAAAIVGICALIYLSVQQSYRSSLNDPQVQFTEDMAAALLAGAKPTEVVPLFRINADQSLAPFVAVYDTNGNPVVSNAMVNGVLPKPPVGVFEHARANGENRVTWSPSAETRIALVVRWVEGSEGRFVASGRNMREVERREADLTAGIGVVLLLTLAVTFALEVLGDIWRRKLAKS